MKILPLPRFVLLTLGVAASGTVSAVQLEVERADDSGLPWGYTDVSDFGVDENPNILNRQNSLIWDHERSINVSESPYVDYMIGAFPGTPGIIAEKATGAFLDATQSTVADLGGGGGAAGVPNPEDRSSPDRYSSGEMPIGSEKFSSFWTFTDGTPLPAATSWYGSCWSGWGPDFIIEMDVRVDLVSDQQINIAHLFNDGWYYSTDLGNYAGEGTAHNTLLGHELTVTHYSANGAEIASQTTVLPSGGGSNILGVANEYAATLGVAPSSSKVRPDGKYYLIDGWAQFYTAKISVTRQAEGDYLMIHHRAANIGYRATLVTLGDDRPWDGDSAPFTLTPNEYNDNAIMGSTYGYSEVWGHSVALGTVYVSLFPDAVYSPDLGWLMAPSGEAASGIFFYRVDTADWIWALSGLNGQVYDFASGTWLAGF